MLGKNLVLWPGNVKMYKLAKVDQNIPCVQELRAFSLNDHKLTVIIVHTCGSCNILIACHCFKPTVNSCGHVGAVSYQTILFLKEAVYQYQVPILASN